MNTPESSTPEPSTTPETYPDETPLSEVKSVWNTTRVTVNSTEEVANITDYPFRDACILLFQKGIFIVSSCGCRNAISSPGNLASITLDYDKLNQDNRRVADSICKATQFRVYDNTIASIYFPVSNKTTVGEVRSYMSEQAAKFVNNK